MRMTEIPVEQQVRRSGNDDRDQPKTATRPRWFPSHTDPNLHEIVHFIVGHTLTSIEFVVEICLDFPFQAKEGFWHTKMRNRPLGDPRWLFL